MYMAYEVQHFTKVDKKVNRPVRGALDLAAA